MGAILLPAQELRIKILILKYFSVELQNYYQI